MKAVKGSPEEKALVQRYVQQLNTQETRLEALRQEIAQLEAKKDSARPISTARSKTCLSI